MTDASAAAAGAALDQPRDRWSTADFDALSWHDNHIHGLSVREGEDALGELVLDIDFILEWLCDPVTRLCKFRIAPATLTFHEVLDLVVSLDYAQASAALCPASIGEILREDHSVDNGSHAWRWAIVINWPKGSVNFLASGFTQVLRAEPVVVSEQVLSWRQRQSLIR